MKTVTSSKNLKITLMEPESQPPYEAYVKVTFCERQVVEIRFEGDDVKIWHNGIPCPQRLE